MTLGDRIRYYRLQKRLSQEQLGKTIGVEPGVISNYENNKNIPLVETVIKLAQTFEISTDNLLILSDCEKAKEVIKEEEWFKLFLGAMSLPKEEKDAVRTILKSLTSKSEVLKKMLGP